MLNENNNSAHMQWGGGGGGGGVVLCARPVWSSFSSGTSWECLRAKFIPESVVRGDTAADGTSPVSLG